MALWHAAAAEVLKPFRGANGSLGTVEKNVATTAGTAPRPLALWHAAAFEAFPGGRRQSWNRTKGFVSCNHGRHLALEGSGSKACGTMTCSCSGGSRQFEGARSHWHWKEAATGLWHYDMQLQRRFKAVGKRQALEGSGSKARTCSCSRGSRPFRGANGRHWHWKEAAGRPVALWHAAAAEA